MLSHGTRLVYTLLASFADTFRIKIRSPMADPFSIVVGTIGVIEVCVHLGKYLQDVKAGAEEDGPKLLAKLDGLRKHLRKRSKEEDFLQIRRKLSNYHSALQVVLTALNM
jgi:hypothetical protein